MASIKVGCMAPGFNLYDQDGNEVNLGDFTGEQNVVLYFYPKAMTPGCTTQACGLRNNNCLLYTSPSPRD